MKVIKKEDFFKELKKYPVEMGFVKKQWIVEIFKKIEFDGLKAEKGEEK